MKFSEVLILLFASVLLHELAHSYLAKRYGVKIESITLFLFGGVSAMEEMPRKPGQEAKMAFAGPLTSLIIGTFFYSIYQYLSPLARYFLKTPSFLFSGLLDR
jgi:Zn-dependent protease